MEQLLSSARKSIFVNLDIMQRYTKIILLNKANLVADGCSVCLVSEVVCWMRRAKVVWDVGSWEGVLRWHKEPVGLR